MDLNRDGFTDIQDIILIAVAITAILGALTLLRKQIVKPLSKWIQHQLAIFFRETMSPDLDAFRREITPVVEDIRHEVTANDGSSLKDLVRRNHAETLAIFEDRDKAFARLAGPADSRVRHVENAVKALDANQREILKRLDGLANQAATDSAKVLHRLENNQATD